jgi:hypothetical protein
MYELSRNSGASISWNPKSLSRPVVGKLYLFFTFLFGYVVIRNVTCIMMRILLVLKRLLFAVTSCTNHAQASCFKAARVAYYTLAQTSRTKSAPTTTLRESLILFLQFILTHRHIHVYRQPKIKGSDITRSSTTNPTCSTAPIQVLLNCRLKRSGKPSCCSHKFTPISTGTFSKAPSLRTSDAILY